MRLHSTTSRSTAANLQHIFRLRNIALAIQSVAVVVAEYGMVLDIPVTPLVGILIAIAFVNAATRARLARNTDVTEPELFGQILFDVAALSGLLYFTGGSTNPFTVFYLLPLALAAMMLPKRYLWTVVGVSASCYSAMLFYHVPLTSVVDSHEAMTKMHIVGMWLTFLLSAGLIAYFVSGIRDRDVLLTQAREQMLRNERILAIGTMAAGAAHELGTPLTTIGVLANELQDQYADHAALVEDLAVLRRQVDTCKNTITNLLASAGHGRLDDAAALPITDFVNGVIEKWRFMRPIEHFEYNVVGIAPAPRIITDETLNQALMNILNNAADASTSHVEIKIAWDHADVSIEVSDRGPGFPDDVIHNIGKTFFTTKNPESGRGLGLFLAKACIERVGGSLHLQNRGEGGSIARLRLPVAPSLA